MGSFRNFTAEQERIIYAFLRGELTLTEAADQYDAEMCSRGIAHRIPVKVNGSGTLYVESSVAAIRPGKLLVMIEAARERLRRM